MEATAGRDVLHSDGFERHVEIIIDTGGKFRPSLGYVFFKHLVQFVLMYESFKGVEHEALGMSFP